MALGSLSLNLALPDAFSTAAFSSILDSLLPAVTSLDLSIATLNDAKTRLAPRSRDESLESGALQLPTGTAVLVDLLSIGEGKLGDTGASFHDFDTAKTSPDFVLAQVSATFATSPPVSHSRSFPTSSPSRRSSSTPTSTLSSSAKERRSYRFVLISSSFFGPPLTLSDSQTECVVYVEPTAGSSTAERPSTDVLDAFRSFISTMKAASFSIPESMSDVRSVLFSTSYPY